MQELLAVAFLIFAGQTLGSLAGLLKRPRPLTLGYLLAFAGAMMVGISLLELVPEALAISSYEFLLTGIVLGLLAIIAIDRSLPHVNPELCKTEKPNVKRSAAMLTIGIALHNLPEGLAIGVGFALEPALGVLIALGIAIQDIPENIATIACMYSVSGKKTKSFAILVGTVLFEAAGFILGYFFLENAPSEILSVALGAAAGIMVYIAVEELFPSARMTEKPYKKFAALLLGLMLVLAMVLLF
jgi:ZIP family zinc transporter